MVGLIDADSLVHKAFHVVGGMRIVEDEKKKWYKVVYDAIIGRKPTNSEKLEEGLQIISNMEASMFNEFEDEMGGIDTFIYFFTTCTNNFRKELSPDYKANRPDKDPFLYELFDEYVQFTSSHSLVIVSDTLEADDLIPKFIRENGLKPTEYCIFNIDKDLDQLEGFHFNYQRVVLKDDKGKVILGEDNEKIMRYKGLEYISKKEAFRNFCALVMIGDSSDNIKGLGGIGKVKAGKLLKDKSIFGMWRVVVEKYLEKESRELLELNIKLMRLR